MKKFLLLALLFISTNLLSQSFKATTGQMEKWDSSKKAWVITPVTKVNIDVERDNNTLTLTTNDKKFVYTLVKLSAKKETLSQRVHVYDAIDPDKVNMFVSIAYDKNTDMGLIGLFYSKTIFYYYVDGREQFKQSSPRGPGEFNN